VVCNKTPGDPDRRRDRPRSGGLHDVQGAQAPFTFGRKCEHRLNVMPLQLREVREELLLGHATGQVLEDVRHGDAGADDARLAAAHGGVDANVVLPAIVRAYCAPPEATKPGRAPDANSR